MKKQYLMPEVIVNQFKTVGMLAGSTEKGDPGDENETTRGKVGGSTDWKDDADGGVRRRLWGEFE